MDVSPGINWLAIVFYVTIVVARSVATELWHSKGFELVYRGWRQLVKAYDVVLRLEFRSVNFTAEVMNVGNLTSVYFEWQRIAAVVE